MTDAKISAMGDVVAFTSATITFVTLTYILIVIVKFLFPHVTNNPAVISIPIMCGIFSITMCEKYGDIIKRIEKQASSK